MKNTIPQKIPVLFSRPKKIPFGQNVRLKKILRTPLLLKYVSGAPGSNGLLSPHPTGSDRTTTWKDSIYKLHTSHNPLIHSDKG